MPPHKKEKKLIIGLIEFTVTRRDTITEDLSLDKLLALFK